MTVQVMSLQLLDAHATVGVSDYTDRRVANPALAYRLIHG